MNHRLSLLAATVVLSSISVSPSRLAAQPRIGQGVQAAVTDEGSEDDRESRRKKRSEQAAFGLGGGLALGFAARAAAGEQQDLCIGACGPLRSASVVGLTYTESSLMYAGASDDAPAARGAKSGVLTLLRGLGSVSEDALDAVSRSSGKPPIASDGMPGNETAAMHRSKAGKPSDHASDNASDNAFDAPAFGCVIGCAPSTLETEAANIGGGTSGVFTSPSVGGSAALLDQGDVGTIVNPEPGTVALMLSGLMAVAFFARRKRAA